MFKRRFSGVLAFVVGAAAFLGCSAPPTESPTAGDGGNNIPTMDSGVDMPPDGAVGDKPCSELAPRAIAPEVFVGPTGLAAKLISYIDGATSSLHISMYQIDQGPIVEALKRAVSRGVQVHLLLDPKQDGNAAAVSDLKAGGVQIGYPSAEFSYYHVKTFVIDGDRAVVMSANLNTYSLTTERNHGVLLRDPYDVKDIDAVFNVDATGGQVPTCTRLVISPTNSRQRIQALIQSAQSTLVLEQLSLADKDIRAALASRAQAGVAVRVILANPAWITENAEAAQVLEASGIQVRFMKNLDNHAKLIIADGKAAFVGSENLSWTSLEKNREVGVVVTETP
ncbi:MAG: hypothetical protein KC417_10040, partial [Myxococcales bacterium]|nr:hypothetical protein [Myxococcales bacterium]